MIKPNLSGLSVREKCALLSISLSSFYYEPKGEAEISLDLMRLIDKQFLETLLWSASASRYIACGNTLLASA